MHVNNTHQKTTSVGFGLKQLEARYQQDIEWLNLPAKEWIPQHIKDNQTVIDVVIIGGGQSGLAVATALKHMHVPAVILDQSPEGFEGPWVTTARMETLRSPKQLTGPALGFSSLTFRAWFEAQFGLDAWNALDKIPREQWMDYLRWYRSVVNVDIRNQHRVEKVIPRPDGVVELNIITPQGPETLFARHLVLATGRDGMGGASLPPLAATFPKKFQAHSSDEMDYNTLKGKRVAVIGAGASAMDSAATALEHGAKRVDFLIRRHTLPVVNKGKGAGNPGLTNGYQHLPDDWKWRIRHYINKQQTPPPHGSTLRVSAFPNARFLFDTHIQQVTVNGDELTVETQNALLKYDFIIFATGFKIDLSLRPEYDLIAPHIRTWADRYTAPVGEEDHELSSAPDLGDAFEFLPKKEGELPGLERIHCFSYPATLTHGTISGDIPGISAGARRMAHGISSALYQEDIEYHFNQLESYVEPELAGNEWVPGQLTPEELK